MLDIQDTKLDGVKIISPKRHIDRRGYFVELYNVARMAEFGIIKQFVQDNLSLSITEGTVRGLHYQAPPFAQDKLVRVTSGRIFDVAVDVRSGSPSFGQWAGEELSADNGKQLLVPIGFLHGFVTLEPNTIVAYKVTNFYDAASDGSVYWASDSLNIKWPITERQAVLSDKDAIAPRFENFQSPF